MSLIKVVTTAARNFTVPTNTGHPTSLQFHRTCIDEWLFSAHTTCPVDERPICAPPSQTRRTNRQAPNLPTSGQRRVVGSLMRARPLRGVAALSRDHQSPQDVQFGVWGQRIQNEAASKRQATPPRLKQCHVSTTMDTIPTYPLTGGSINPLLTNINPSLTSTTLPPLQEPRPSLCDNSRQQFRGQRSLGKDLLYGMGVASQNISPPIGRLRKGCIAGAHRRYKVMSHVLIAFQHARLHYHCVA